MIRRAIAALSLIFALAPVLATAATRYDPRLRFRTISTVRFDIHFHQDEEEDISGQFGEEEGPRLDRAQ